MNDIAFHVQLALEEGTAENPVSLSDLEYRLADTPMGAMDYNFPRDVALELLTCGGGAA